MGNSIVIDWTTEIWYFSSNLIYLPFNVVLADSKPSSINVSHQKNKKVSLSTLYTLYIGSASVWVFHKVLWKNPNGLLANSVFYIYNYIYIYIHTYIHTHTHTYTYTQIYIKLTWVKSPFGLYGKTQMDFWPTQYFIEGNGTPLQYYCLENPMGRAAW